MVTRRAMEWFDTILVDLVLADGGALQVDLSAGVPESLRKGATVTRIVGQLYPRNDTANTVKVIPWGVAFVNSDAVAASAFPDPSDVADRADWLARGVMLSSNGSDLFAAVGPNRHEFDLRAQRVCRSEQDLLHIMFEENGTFAGGSFISGMIRVLMKLR